jgi:hypothetical protein
LQANRVAALVAEIGRVRVVRAAFLAEHFARVKWIGDNRGAAILTSSAQVVQSLEVTAFALPVADRIVNKFKLRDIAEIRNREYRLKDRLQTSVIALARQLVHLQETVVRALLNLDQVRDLDGCRNFGEIETCTVGAILRHSETPNFQRSRGLQMVWRGHSRPRLSKRGIHPQRGRRDRASMINSDSFVKVVRALAGTSFPGSAK